MTEEQRLAHEREEILQRVRWPSGFNGFAKGVDLKDTSSGINQLTPKDYTMLVALMHGTQQMTSEAANQLYASSTYANHTMKKTLKETIDNLKVLVNDMQLAERCPGVLKYPNNVFEGNVPAVCADLAGSAKLGIVCLSMYGFPTPAMLAPYKGADGGIAPTQLPGQGGSLQMQQPPAVSTPVPVQFQAQFQQLHQPASATTTTSAFAFGATQVSATSGANPLIAGYKSAHPKQHGAGTGFSGLRGLLPPVAELNTETASVVHGTTQAMAPLYPPGAPEVSGGGGLTHYSEPSVRVALKAFKAMTPTSLLVSGVSYPIPAVVSDMCRDLMSQVRSPSEQLADKLDELMRAVRGMGTTEQAAILQFLRQLALENATVLKTFLLRVIEQKDDDMLYRLRMLIPAQTYTRDTGSPDVDTHRALCERLRSTGVITTQPAEFIDRLKRELPAEVFQKVCTRRLAATEYAAQDRIALTVALYVLRKEEVATLREMLSLVVVTPSTSSCIRRVISKTRGAKHATSALEPFGFKPGGEAGQVNTPMQCLLLSHATRAYAASKGASKAAASSVVLATLKGLRAAEDINNARVDMLKAVTAGDEADRAHAACSAYRDAVKASSSAVNDNVATWSDAVMSIKPSSAVGMLDQILHSASDKGVPKKQCELFIPLVYESVEAIVKMICSEPADSASLAKKLSLLSMACHKRLSVKKDVYKTKSLMDHGGRAIFTTSTVTNLVSRGLLQHVSSAFRYRPLEAFTDRRGFIYPGTSKAAQLAAAADNEGLTLIHTGENLLGGAADEFVLMLDRLRGGRLTLVVGDSAYIAGSIALACERKPREVKISGKDGKGDEPKHPGRPQDFSKSAMKLGAAAAEDKAADPTDAKADCAQAAKPVEAPPKKDEASEERPKKRKAPLIAAEPFEPESPSSSDAAEEDLPDYGDDEDDADLEEAGAVHKHDDEEPGDEEVDESGMPVHTLATGLLYYVSTDTTGSDTNIAVAEAPRAVQTGGEVKGSWRCGAFRI